MFNVKQLKNMTLHHCTRTSNRNDHYHNIFKHIDYVTLMSFLITKKIFLNKVSLFMLFNTLRHLLPEAHLLCTDQHSHFSYLYYFEAVNYL